MCIFINVQYWKLEKISINLYRIDRDNGGDDNSGSVKFQYKIDQTQFK